jgi:hypothetical protein
MLSPLPPKLRLQDPEGQDACLKVADALASFRQDGLSRGHQVAA